MKPTSSNPRKLLPLLSVVLLCAPLLPVGAQMEELPRSEIRAERMAEILTQRESIIARNLPLDPDERKAFWPIYRKYRAERDEIDTRANKLISDFQKNYNNVTTDLARNFTSTILDLQRADLAIKTKYLRSFEKAITAPKAAKFYQIENKLDATLSYYRAQQIPLMP
jgi:hypothetical protein